MEDLHLHMDAMRAPWITGDFGAMSRAFGQPVANDFVAGLDDVRGKRVLDVACGTGAATLPLARRGAFATGLDLAPNLLSEARAAATVEHLSVRFDEGFAEQLPYADGSFDLAVSMFGVIFSPFPDRVATDLHRILAKNGRIALANWTQESFSGRSQALAKPYLAPSPADAKPPFAWGEDAAIRSLLEPYFKDISTEVVPTRWSIPSPPAEAAAFFAENAGPLRLLLDRMSSRDRSALMADFARLFDEENQAPPDTGRTDVATEYLKVTATRR